MRALIRFLLTLCGFAAGPALGAVWPILDSATIPGLTSEAGRASYNAFLVANLPRAFAVAAEGVGSGAAFGWSSGLETSQEVQAEALQRCADQGGKGCRLYADNLDIVWPGRVWHPPPPPQALIETMNYSVVPDPRFLWRGPGAAAGVYVWSHGKGPRGDSDNRGHQPQPHVRWFNNAGYDIVRFDRYPTADERQRAASWLRDVLVDLRGRGYRSVIAGGQSRGGWTSLQMTDTPGLADAIIAISPAAHGTGSSLNLTAQSDDLRRLFADAPPQRTRVAFVQFRDDPFIGDADTRRVLVTDSLRPKIGSLLLIDRPGGFSGHGAGNSFAFGESFGRCLLDWATAPKPPSACSAARATPSGE